jgi:PAS domain-containing protein
MKPPPPRPSNGPRAWSAAAVFAGIGLTLFATYYASRTIKLRTQARFQAAVEQTRATIQNRVEACVALLRSGAGPFAVEPRLSRKQFQTYVDRLRLPTNYPGMQGIGVSVRLAPEEKDALITFMLKQGVADFNIWPVPDRPEYHTILCLEPLDKRNQAAIGYDMFTEPVRREAMERARDEAIPIVSRRVTWVQEIEGPKQWGFLIYVPVYEENAIPSAIALRARENLLREKQLSDAIINSLPGIFYLIDHRGKFLRWNRTLEEVSGYDAQEIAGMHAWDFFRDEARPAVEERIREVFAVGEASAEADLLAKGRHLLPYLLTGGRFDLEGTPCFVGMGQAGSRGAKSVKSAVAQ